MTGGEDLGARSARRAGPTLVSSDEAGGSRSVYRRIQRTGNGARWVCIPTTTIFTLAFALPEILDPLPRDDKPLVIAAASIIVILATLRSALIGIFISDTHIIARSWLVTYRWTHEQVVAVRPLPYEGLLNEGNIDGSGKFLVVVGFRIRSARGDRWVVIRGTISSRRSLSRQLQQIREQL